MGEIRQATLLIRDKLTTGGALPSNTLMAEPFVNLYDGVLQFSGVTGGGYEPSSVASVFEVGSTLYNSKITNRLNINDNFIISGDTGLISTYGATSGAGLVGKFLSGTTSGFVLGNIVDIQGVTTRVQPGTNITTGGTADNPTVNLVDSPSINGLTASGTSNFTGVIQSGGTDLYNIFLTSGDLSGTTVSAGSNVSVNNVGNDYEVSVIDSPSFNDITFSGTATGGDAIVGEMSATTFYSGSTDVETIIYNIAESISGTHTFVQNGTNTLTGGTDLLPTVNIVDSPSFNNIEFSGTATGGNVFATELSGGTIYSGSTDLYSIFQQVGADTNHTYVQNGTNIITGGTTAEPTINLVDSPSINGLTASGTSNFTGVIQSGGTDLYSIFATEDTVDVVRVQGGTNITTGGTDNFPVVNVIDSPVFAGLVSATGFTDSSLTAGRVTYAGVGGRLTDEALFEYDAVADLLKTQNIQIGNPGDTGTTTTIFGDLLIMGEGISGFTSELYIEDNLIELNYNPTASTISTSLGAGWSIQDGSGVGGTDVFWDIRGAATGVANREFTTNLVNIRVAESGTTASPNGLYVLKSTDVIDGGSY